MDSVAKHFHRLMKRLGKLTDEQATISEIDWDDGNLQQFNVILRPNSGLYKNGKFKFQIKLTDEYPEIPPVVWCHTDIYHPNIDPTNEYCDLYSTNVCLNLLDTGVWNRSFGLEGTVLGLLFLMHNPNLQDQLSPYMGHDDLATYRANVRKYMADEDFDDIINCKKDFCVKDGVLIEDMKPDTSDETENSECSTPKCYLTDTSRNEGNKEDSTCLVAAEAANPTDKTYSDELSDVLFNEEPVLNTDINNNIASSITEKGEGLQGTLSTAKIEQTTEDIDALIGDDNDTNYDKNDSQIELITIDGECLLMIHHSADYDLTIEGQECTINTNEQFRT